MKRGHFKIPKYVGAALIYHGRVIASIVGVEPFGRNRKVTFSNGYVVIVPRMSALYGSKS